jgi:hypothetical protein
VTRKIRRLIDRNVSIVAVKTAKRVRLAGLSAQRVALSLVAVPGLRKLKVQQRVSVDRKLSVLMDHPLASARALDDGRRLMRAGALVTSQGAFVSALEVELTGR